MSLSDVFNRFKQEEEERKKREAELYQSIIKKQQAELKRRQEEQKKAEEERQRKALEAIKEKEHWDNIFIYSDQQAGHGGLYGIGNAYAEYSCTGGRYFDVMKMIDKYRSTVNPKVNIFSVQTAGYTNVVIPESTYRGAVLYGWTGKELQYADSIIKFWDEKEIK